MLLDLALLFISVLLLGKLCDLLGIPDLVGMIVAGILLGHFGVLGETLVSISPDLRQIALIVILTRAGLSLDLSALKRSPQSAILLSFLPATFEIAGVALLGTLLFGMDIISALLLGSVLSAVSPAVIVPRMISLKAQGYGKESGVPDLVMAGASVDDIYVIILFYTFLNFNPANLLSLPIGLVLGLAFGIVAGLLLSMLGKRITPKGDTLYGFTILVLSVSFLLMALEDVIPLSPLLAIMVCAFVLGKKAPQVGVPLEGTFGGLWAVFRRLLFFFVGYAVSVDNLIAYGILPLVLLVGALVIRSIGTYLAVSTSHLNCKEKLFCVISYLPKATVQAGIGAIPLTMGHPYGALILTLAAISIVVTAPVGAILIDSNYKKLLKKS